MSQLRVIIDGRTLPEPEARALWTRFSAHMDQHQGDFEGFARAEGYGRASVAVTQGIPTLTLQSAEGPGKKGEGGRAQSADDSAQPAGKSQKPKKRAAKPRKKTSKPRPNQGRGRKHGTARKQATPDDGRGGESPPRRPSKREKGG